MSIPKSKQSFKKCEEFSICTIRCDKGWIGIETTQKNNGLYHYCVYGSGRFDVPFQNHKDKEINPKDFFDMREHLDNHVMIEAFEDFYWIGFNRLPNETCDWDGRLIKEDVLTVEKESWMICFDGQPIVNNKKLSRFDYTKVYPDREYKIDFNEGVLSLFTKI